MAAPILLTAFEPYDDWAANASWLALVEFTRLLPPEVELVTRKYPVDFSKIRQMIEEDLRALRPPLAIHLGQAPGAASIALEAIALNVRGHVHDGRDKSPPPAEAGPAAGRPIVLPDGASTLAVDGPPAYRSKLPLADLAETLRASGVPSRVSFHAGTFLCNAVYYWSQHLARLHELNTKSLFLHIPLAPEQVIESGRELPSLPSATVAAAVGMIAASEIRG